jgi:hypothetical protein
MLLSLYFKCGTYGEKANGVPIKMQVAGLKSLEVWKLRSLEVGGCRNNQMACIDREGAGDTKRNTTILDGIKVPK